MPKEHHPGTHEIIRGSAPKIISQYRSKGKGRGMRLKSFLKYFGVDLRIAKNDPGLQKVKQARREQGNRDRAEYLRNLEEYT